MLRVSISRARPGMTLAMPILHPSNPGTVLLRAGADLTGQSIARLREIDCREVWVRCPGLEHIRDYIRPDVYAAHGELAGHLTRGFQSMLRDADPELEFGSYRGAVASLIDRLVQDSRSNIYVQEMVETNVRGLQHAANVCLLSVLIGLKLDSYLERERPRLSPGHARDVTPLGLGALLHDVGMLRIDKDAAERWMRGGDETDPVFRRHVELGYQIVRGRIEPAASAVVLHHHQRYDGAGFPTKTDCLGVEQGLAGRDIHIFARIASVADTYNRLRYPLGDATPEPTPVVRVLRMMMHGSFAPRFDPVVLKGLLAVVPPFAPGTTVRLCDERWAIVSQWTPDDPCRPVVEALPPGQSVATDVDPDDRERIDLSGSSELEIHWAEGVDVSKDTFYASDSRGLDLSRLAASMALESR